LLTFILYKHDVLCNQMIIVEVFTVNSFVCCIICNHYDHDFVYLLASAKMELNEKGVCLDKEVRNAIM